MCHGSPHAKMVSPISVSPRPGTAGAQLSAGGGACLSPHSWWQALDCDCPWPGSAAHPDESGPWKWLKRCQPGRAASGCECVQVSPPAPSRHGDWRSEAQGGPCQSLLPESAGERKERGHRETPGPHHSLAMLPGVTRSVSETGVPAAQGWCVHQVTVVTSETPRGLASSCQPLLMRRSPALSNSLAPVRPHSARVWTWAAPCTALSWASDGSGISTPWEVGGQCCSDVGVPSGRASARPRGVLFFNITALF